ncbi:MAG TPA: hypothetical protein VIX17_11490 [Pyrinomonadaceae bacterium]
MAAGAAVKGQGGKKGRSGRKSRAEELGLSSLLDDAFTLSDRKAVIANLRDIALGSDAKSAVSAASLLFGYTYGKPTEKHEHGGEGGGPIVLKVVYDSKP